MNQDGVPVPGVSCRETGGNLRHTHHNDAAAAGNPIDRAADSLIDQSLHAERLYLSASWCDEQPGIKGAEHAGLEAAHFALDWHGKWFGYLVECAHKRRRPDATEFLQTEIATRIGPTPAELWRIVRTNIAEVLRDFHADTRDVGPQQKWTAVCEAYAARVVELAERRVEASICLRRFSALANLDDFIVEIRPRVEQTTAARRPGDTARIRTSRGSRRIIYA